MPDIRTSKATKVTTYHLDNLRDCNKKAAENPKDAFFIHNPEYLEGCLEGKAFLDKEIIKDLKELLDTNPELDLSVCNFAYNNQEYNIRGKQGCLDFYTLKSNEIYNLANELEITYFMSEKTIEDSLEDENQLLTREEILQQINTFREDVNAIESLISGPMEKQRGKLFNYITQKYKISEDDIYSEGSKLLSLKEYIDSHLPGDDLSFCSVSGVKAKYVVICTVNGKDLYGFSTCYAQVNPIPLTDLELVDNLIDMINRLKMQGATLEYSLDEGKDFYLKLHTFCSEKFDSNEELSHEYYNYFNENIGHSEL